MPKISIIVPMFNSARFLDRCVRSLRNQTLQDIEIILVNDASPDDSLNMVKEYSKQDARIRVIDLAQNIVASRNAGIEIAIGEYLGFVDADDWVEPEMYEKLYNSTNDGTVDVAIGGIKDCYESGRVISEQQFKECNEDAISIKKYVANNGGRLFTNIWKRSLITSDLLFKEHNLYCDSIVNAWYLKANSFSIVKEDLYNYYINDASITHRKNSYAMFDRLSAAQDFKNRSINNGLYDLYKEEIDYIYFRLYFRNTLLQIGYLFTKVPLKKVREFRNHFLSENGIDGNSYYLNHKNETATIISRIVIMNLYLGIILLQCLIFYLSIFKRK